MPAAFAHLTFGRRVLDALPDASLKKLIQKHQALFEIGLQGPDILFFFHPLSHHPVNRLGHTLHEKSAVSFLDRPLCRNADDLGFAYLLGFVCHYALDSECHTLVEYYMEKTGRGHSDIETDLERELMTLEGLPALKHAPASYVQDSTENAAVIAPFYGVDVSQLKAALTTMKLVSRTLRPSNRVKHSLLTGTGRLMGEGSIVSELTMDWNPNPIYGPGNKALIERMDLAIPVAIALMENFFLWRSRGDTLSQRFEPTFSFDPKELARLKERDKRV